MGHHVEVVAEFQRLVPEHPSRERFQAQLMLALYRSGRQSEASTAYQRARELLEEQQGMEPSPELQKLLTDIPNQDSALELSSQTMVGASTSAPKTTLPLQLTSFVGRKREITEVLRLLRTTRLLTLVGAGGVGKTRLALEAGSEPVDHYADGVWFVELAPATDPDVVPQIMLATLEFTAQPGRTPLESLVGAVAPQGRLCTIDNCAHLVEACARLADSLLKRCTRLQVLATSREPCSLCIALLSSWADLQGFPSANRDGGRSVSR